MINAFDEARERGLRIVYADEAVFTFNTFQAKTWSHKGQTFGVPEKSLALDTYAIVTGVSQLGGLELSVTHRRSISSTQFVEFIEALSESFGGAPFALFMDNMRAHHSGVVKEAMSRLSVLPIFNVPYSPQFNGIESVFSMVKATY